MCDGRIPPAGQSRPRRDPGRHPGTTAPGTGAGRGPAPCRDPLWSPPRLRRAAPPGRASPTARWIRCAASPTSEPRRDSRRAAGPCQSACRRRCGSDTTGPRQRPAAPQRCRRSSGGSRHALVEASGWDVASVRTPAGVEAAQRRDLAPRRSGLGLTSLGARRWNEAVTMHSRPGSRAPRTGRARIREDVDSSGSRSALAAGVDFFS